MKTITLIFCGPNGDVAKAAAVKIRADGGSAQLRSAEGFDVSEQDAADHVIIMSDVSPFDRGRIEAAYGDKVRVEKSAEKPKLSLPPAPAAPLPPAPRGK